VDRYEEAARKYRKREATDLRWGHRIEEPGVMDLIRPEDVVEKLRAWQSASRVQERPDPGQL
jgi:heptosyltransferase I